jgi:hypothetical protein
MQAIMVHLVFMSGDWPGGPNKSRAKRKEGDPKAAHFALEANIIPRDDLCGVN